MNKSLNYMDDELQTIHESEFIFKIKRQSLDLDEQREIAKANGFSLLSESLGRESGNRHMFLYSCNVCNYRVNAAYSYMRKSKVSCKNCFNNKLKKEADQFGLTLISDSKDGNKARRHYLFNSCGHTRDIATADVRINAFSCTECIRNILIKNCERNGVELLNYSAGENRCLVRFNDCGHEKVAIKTHINDESSSISCSVCHDIKVESLFKNSGLTILRYIGNTRRLVKFDSCEHEKVVTLSNVVAGRVSCRICLESKFAKEASEAGLVYLGKSSPGKKYDYLAPCGCKLKLDIKHVRIGYWCCRTCETTYHDVENNLYLVKMSYENFTWLKLGFSKVPQSRVSEYKLRKGISWEVLSVVKTTTGKLAEKYERALHKKHSEYVLDKTLMKNYLLESGFTECYPIDMLDVLTRELENYTEE